MKNNLTTTQSTDLVLKKSKSTLGITKRILSGSKSFTTKSNKDVILNPDVMMINGLMWQKETVEEEMKWEEAMEYAENLRLGEYDDWRLPTREELQAVVTSCSGILNDYENNESNEYYQTDYQEKGFISSDYWSSSTLASNTNVAWYVDFYFGYTSYLNKDYSKYVRCVRAG
jgi:hypothetical protein